MNLLGGLTDIMGKRFDVVIVGAALNGLAAGLALGGHRSRRPLSVAIVDVMDPYLRVSSAGVWKRRLVR